MVNMTAVYIVLACVAGFFLGKKYVEYLAERDERIYLERESAKKKMLEAKKNG